MTDEEWKASVTRRLDQITETQAEMKECQTELKEGQTELKTLAQRWETPPPGQTMSRLDQIDRLLVVLWAGKMTGRMILWFAGTIVAIGAALPLLRGWIGK